MILQALKEYYDRKAADPDSGIAPFGWEWKEIPFLVIMDKTGKFLRLEDTRESQGKKLIAHRYLVPALGESKGNGIKSNLFWENAEYIFGIAYKPTSKPRRVAEQHAAFLDKIRLLQPYAGNSSVYRAVVAFVESDFADLVLKDPLWTVVLKEPGPNFLLSIDGCGPVSDDVDMRNAIDSWYAKSKDAGVRGRCLVSGEMDTIVRLEPNITGFTAMGIHIVSVNNEVKSGGNGGETPAFSSFRKEKAYNSPIGVKAAFAYTTALNTLLGKNSRQKIRLSDNLTIVFWASRDDLFEDEFGMFFEDPPKDDPDRLTNNVRALYASIKTGAFSLDAGKTSFYVLGLTPSTKSRLSIRFWSVGTIAQQAALLRQYFDDLTVVHGSYDRDHLSLWRLLVSTAPQGKSENINPRLSGEMMRSILSGLPFPETLLQAVLVRIKAEREVSYPRAKLVKGYLCRKFMLTQEERNKLVSLNKDNTNVGYRLGRLFAALEKTQLDANPGINATIRDRFYAAASSSPVTVFGNLMRMSNHWLAKIESNKPGLAVVRKQLIGEIANGIAAFPAHLAIADQGYFALGYYHQQQDFFTKKDSNKETVNQKGSEE